MTFLKNPQRFVENQDTFQHLKTSLRLSTGVQWSSNASELHFFTILHYSNGKMYIYTSCVPTAVRYCQIFFSLHLSLGEHDSVSLDKSQKLVILQKINNLEKSCRALFLSWLHSSQARSHGFSKIKVSQQTK